MSNYKTEVVEEVTKKHDDLLSNTIEHSPRIDSLINLTLDNINKQFNFNKSVIFVYHNNVTMTNAVPFIRMSMSHERILEKKFKVESEIKLMQNVPVSLYSSLNSQLFNYKYVCTTTESLKSHDLNEYIRLTNMNITGYIAVLIENSKGTPLATLICYTADRELLCDQNIEYELNVRANWIKELLKYANYVK